MLRLHPPLLPRLDAWIAEQRDAPSRPEAIRRLLERSLGAPAMPRQPSKAATRKASSLAARELDTLGDKSQSADEQERRKRRLIRGPREFRGMRGDQPKSKI